MLQGITNEKIMESFAATKCCKDDNEEQFHKDHKFCSKEANKQFLAEGSPIVPWVWHEDNTMTLRFPRPALSNRNVM